MLLPRRTACWLCIGPGSDGVEVHTFEPLKSSADDRVLLPVDEPPAISTLPFATIEAGSTVALWPNRAEVIVPADDQDPFETAGSKRSAEANTAEPFFPPVTRIFPLVPGSTDAVCCSRGLLIEVSVLKAD